MQSLCNSSNRFSLRPGTPKGYTALPRNCCTPGRRASLKSATVKKEISVEDLPQRRFARLTIQSLYRSNGKLRAVCICDCGADHAAPLYALKSGNTKSCGCLQREIRQTNGEKNKVHGAASNGRQTREYRSWEAMRSRCLNPKDQAFARYGGRGIKVCKAWDSFVTFLSDMGTRPPGTTIDRIDNDGNYEPGNCRWATRKIQAMNKRSTLLISLNGETLPMMEACHRHGKPYPLIHDRMRRLGWTAENAFSKPIRSTNITTA